ncbi:MAG: sugar ABC transporter ATP-binding protein [Verrucomicrobia bacterium]|nr:sugar ABC transporter ATP-binding protein [Verrucomicrobiota bacterium]
MFRAEHLLQVTRLQKSYNVPVLVDFSFDLRRGEVHALVGSNGAGKSTYARILSGLTERDGGEIQLDGEPYIAGSKREAEHAGVIMVLQELNVIGTMSVAENIFLNRLPQRGGFLRFDALHREARQALARVGLGEVDPAAPARYLGVGQQQLVEIAGALSQNCRLLILDEPTAALTDPEIEQLFGNIRRLQGEGVGIIYISHRMDEIRRIADRITVMRDGRAVASHNASQATSAVLVREMVGHDLPERKRSRQKRSEEPSLGEVALRVRHLRVGERVRDISFEVRRGEILGFAGLIGSGRTETVRAIFGADAKDGGEILVGEQPVAIRSPADALRAGIGLVPEDRKKEGLLAPQSVRVNTTLSTVARHANVAGWLDTDAETETTKTFCRRLQVGCLSYEQGVGELSGGNQQKVLIARWLARDCRVLLFDEPTRGIDAAAKDTIHALLHDLAAQGKAVVIVSSELVELMALCDRLIVLSQGRIAAEFTPEDWTQEKITHAAFSGYLDRQQTAINP